MPISLASHPLEVAVTMTSEQFVDEYEQAMERAQADGASTPEKVIDNSFNYLSEEAQAFYLSNLNVDEFLMRKIEAIENRVVGKPL